MAKFLGLVLGVLAAAHETEHEHTHDRRCGTESYMESMFEKYPEWKRSLDEFEVDWQLKQKQIERGEIKQELQTVTIPIVFHVLYRLTNQNVPDSAIAYQLNVLNQDFRGTNPDISNTPSAFTSPTDLRSGDFGITYTNDQVIRKATSVVSFSTNNNIKYDSSGGSNVVQPSSKLNFWSGNIGGGILGYAQFPGGSPNTDGVVNAFGTLAPSTGSPPYNLGRTATHEIGHWLNLRHIWGDSSSCNVDDGVSDTPPSSSPNYGCPSNPNNAPRRCSNNPYPYDMYCNYMDYSEDACLIMFTTGQKSRSWASINQYRQGFNPSNILKADVEYVNWVYFIEYDHEITNDNDKCWGGVKELFYDDNLNENSNSNKYIYGCMHKTRSTNTRHITDVKFIYGLNSVCDDGYEQATQNLNIGNDANNPIYMCYKREESNIDNNDAVLDITFVRDADVAKLSSDWTVLMSDNINPNGVQLNLAIKKGKYILDEELLGNGSPNNIDNSNTGNVASNLTKDGTYVIAGLIGVLIIAYVVWKFVCSRKGFKDAISTNDEELIYGRSVYKTR